ncbi:hypothetical protein DFH06DRAFT_1138647 [Mycena polygramma]|nr:hypothetical protein DFH06DRAFT_1138647 [Mycena polygramma]
MVTQRVQGRQAGRVKYAAKLGRRSGELKGGAQIPDSSRSSCDTTCNPQQRMFKIKLKRLVTAGKVQPGKLVPRDHGEICWVARSANLKVLGLEGQNRWKLKLRITARNCCVSEVLPLEEWDPRKSAFGGTRIREERRGMVAVDMKTGRMMRSADISQPEVSQSATEGHGLQEIILDTSFTLPPAASRFQETSTPEAALVEARTRSRVPGGVTHQSLQSRSGLKSRQGWPAVKSRLDRPAPGIEVALLDKPAQVMDYLDGGMLGDDCLVKILTFHMEFSFTRYGSAKLEGDEIMDSCSQEEKWKFGKHCWIRTVPDVCRSRRSVGD